MTESSTDTGLRKAVGEFIEGTKAIMPMVRAHFQELRMDTAEDEELRMRMLGMVEWWGTKVEALGAITTDVGGSE